MAVSAIQPRPIPRYTWSRDGVRPCAALPWRPVGPEKLAGGDLAEGFVHGMNLVTEAVRQVRGTSVNEVPDADRSLITGGPGVGSAATL